MLRHPQVDVIVAPSLSSAEGLELSLQGHTQSHTQLALSLR